MSVKITNEKIEERLVKHTFTKEERLELGGELARAISAQRGVEAEYDAVKNQFKARISEAEARVESLGTNITDGFCMRTKRCKVIFRPKDRKKDYYPEIKDGIFDPNPVLTEPMTNDDFNADLFEAESRFERRAEIQLAKDVVLVLGRLKDRWYGALRVTIGQAKLAERLDPAGKKFKLRVDALTANVKRLDEWIVSQFGEETAKGFRGPIEKIVEIQKDLAE